MILIETQAGQLARATSDVASVAALGSLNLAELNLFQSQIPISPSVTLAELQAAVCDYTGYAAEVITWGVAGVADDGTVEVIGTLGEFRPTDAVTPNVAWGCWIENAANNAVYFMGQFDNPPLPMTSALQSINLTVRYRPATNSVVVVVS